MAIEQTLSIIKPDGVSKGLIGEILGRFEKNGLEIKALKMVKLTKKSAQAFYAVHKDKGFYDSLTEFMSSGPVVALVLAGANAINKNRELMGATDFRKAAPGTIRADFASDIERNIVHGSDGPETAQTEIAFFFNEI
jgi:nucleoside-diphosphate kinase